MKPAVAIAIVLAQAVNALALSASAQSLRGMATAEAIGAFAKVCGSTAPDFENAETEATALGHAFNKKGSVDDFAIEVTKSADGVPMCEVNFATSEQLPEVVRQLQLGFDLGPDVDPESYRKPATLARIRFEDESYGGTDHIAWIRVGEERRLGRFNVSLLLWGKK